MRAIRTSPVLAPLSVAQTVLMAVAGWPCLACVPFLESQWDWRMEGSLDLASHPKAMSELGVKL